MKPKTCAVAGCPIPSRSRGWCATHYRRWLRHGDVRTTQPIETGAVARSYGGVRRRLTAERGAAAGHRCAQCGMQAAVWSYDGADPDELRDPARGYRYSLDPTRYRAVCRACLRGCCSPGNRAVALDVDRAVRLYQAGATARGIGAHLGVSSRTVLAALRGSGVAIRPTGRTPRQARPRHSRATPPAPIDPATTRI